MYVLVYYPDVTDVPNFYHLLTINSTDHEGDGKPQVECDLQSQ